MTVSILWLASPNCAAIFAINESDKACVSRKLQCNSYFVRQGIVSQPAL